MRHLRIFKSNFVFCLCVPLFLSIIPLGTALADTKFIDPEHVVLTIEGNIAAQNEDQNNTKIEFDLATLTALGATTFTSSAPWTAEPTQYTGVRINTLLESVGAKSNQFEAIADNDYMFTLSDINFDKYPVIVAYKKNGEFFGVRHLGPLLIMFPFDDYPELVTERNKAASVWQLIKLRVL